MVEVAFDLAESRKLYLPRHKGLVVVLPMDSVTKCFSETMRYRICESTRLSTRPDSDAKEAGTLEYGLFDPETRIRNAKYFVEVYQKKGILWIQQDSYERKKMNDVWRRQSLDK